MIEQAARNDAFEAQKLEQWASMVKALKDIAGKKMPSVADLLKKSAGAEGAKSPPSPSSSPSNEKPDPQQQANATPSNSQPSAPKVENGEKDQASGKSKPQDPNAPTKPQAPSIADREKSFFEKPKDDEQKKAEPGKPSSSALGLPGTQLGAAPAKPEDKKPEEAKTDSPAKQQLDKALDEQKELLAAFAKVTDQLKDLLASLEGSTFVKRLKAASRKQIGIANALTSDTLSAFGLNQKKVVEMVAKKAAEVAAQQTEASSVVRLIQSDLEAYFQRKQDMRFKNILDQMKKTEIAAALLRVGEEAKSNWSGRSISASEYWADTLDRWAEEMVAAAKAGGESKGESKPQESLPPEVVLKVMQVLFDEMKLRDETREAENAKPALEKKDYFKRATGLAEKQDEIGRRTYEVAAEISKLPKAQSFQKEMKLLMKATEVMKEAYQMLDKPDTGAAVVAAETEVIEMLLEARRPPPGGGGGGGGGNNPGGGGSGSASSAALAELGPGVDPTANVQERETGQSTGKAGKEFPEEFKAGLDAYFNALEAQQK
jgi:hypothetical protein